MEIGVEDYCRHKRHYKHGMQGDHDVHIAVSTSVLNLFSVSFFRLPFPFPVCRLPHPTLTIQMFPKALLIPTLSQSLPYLVQLILTMRYPPRVYYPFMYGLEFLFW
jgi:hypothetical protein